MTHIPTSEAREGRALQDRTGFEREIQRLGIAETASGTEPYVHRAFDLPVNGIYRELADNTKIPATLGQTLYLPIQLSREVLPKVGVFMPTSLRNATAIDLIVYLHGHIIPDCKNDQKKFEKDGIEYYWNTPYFTCLREDLASSATKAMLIAPTMRPFFGGRNHPSGYFGDFNKAGTLDRLVSDTFEHLKALRAIAANAEPRQIVVAGHSAGGRPMQLMLTAKNTLGSKVTQCWGFECLYFGLAEWNAWLSANSAKQFIHYRRKSKFVTQTRTLSAYKNFLDVNDGRGHCTLLQEKWRSALAQWNATATPILLRPLVAPSRATATASAQPLRFVEEDLLRGNPLSTTRKVLYATGDRGRRVTIEEPPAIYVPAIIGIGGELARAKKHVSTADQLDPVNWFRRMVRSVVLTDGNTAPFTFLGRGLVKNEYLHLELATLLKSIERRFMTELSLPARAAGDLLLNNRDEAIAGTRPQSSSAKYSFHMFGLAVDVNYLGNPFVNSGDIAVLNGVLANAAALTSTAPLRFSKDLGGDIGARYDAVHALDQKLEQYFALLDDEEQLRGVVATSQAWKTMTIADARSRVQNDLDRLAGALVRTDTKVSKRKSYFKTNAILNFDRRFVVGMEGLGLYWGGRYGDMMHYDMRKTGVGYYINEARTSFERRIRQLADGFHQRRQYGSYTSTGQRLST